MAKILAGLGALWLLLSAGAAHAAEGGTLIIVNAGPEADAADVQVLDMAAGHFASSVRTLSAEAALEEELDRYSHIIYFGADRRPPAGLLAGYDGPLLLIGDHLDELPQARTLKEPVVRRVERIASADGEWAAPADKLLIDYGATGAGVLYTGRSGEGEWPLLYREGQTFFAAMTDVTGTAADVLGEALFDFYGKKRREPKKFLRLEDVHPKTDPDRLREIGDYLAERDIPYAITVIPVYSNPETGKRVKLAQEPELVDVLRDLQESGASIILHGYFHRYRDQETGEGSEYWDMEYDRPIYQAKDDRVYLREDFAADAEWDAFVAEGLEFERAYISESVRNGVAELTALGLYPLAFEAPHYTMSQSGLAVLSEMFTTYVGEVQTSDATYSGSYAPLFSSRPAQLHGMRAVPETLGYIRPGDPAAEEKMLGRAAYVSAFSDSWLALFYHPYLGLGRLENVLSGMEAYGDYAWVDLKELPNRVTAGGIIIESHNGEISVERTAGVLVAQTARQMWWIAVPLAVALLVLWLSLKRAMRMRRRSGIS
ncbi:polysaccharide deacetylase family protein [Indiicoccus explosivorum]|uniref:polysaccharide deacetylase family protein n=1 Tax=Indiicoccus explosivorum TaxID=1917864 RepID=UPI000B44144F|nr:polysaccharide deacetylase family protein [Indiicoccus explosivorum]